MSPLLSFPPPLKSICSTQCEIPVTPGFSFLDPTLYIAQHPETGALGISRIRTLSPLSRTLRLTCNSLKRDAERSNQSGLLSCSKRITSSAALKALRIVIEKKRPCLGDSGRV